MKTTKSDSARLRRLAVLDAIVLEANNDRHGDLINAVDANPEAHIEVTLTVAEVRTIRDWARLGRRAEPGMRSGALGLEPRRGLGAVNGSAIESARRAEILPCPFCGSEIGPISFGRAGYGVGAWRWKINCDTCWTSGPMAETVEAARDLWNRRAENAKSPNEKADRL